MFCLQGHWVKIITPHHPNFTVQWWSAVPLSEMLWCSGSPPPTAYGSLCSEQFRPKQRRLAACEEITSIFKKDKFILYRWLLKSQQMHTLGSFLLQKRKFEPEEVHICVFHTEQFILSLCTKWLLQATIMWGTGHADGSPQNSKSSWSTWGNTWSH